MNYPDLTPKFVSGTTRHRQTPRQPAHPQKALGESDATALNLGQQAKIGREHPKGGWSKGLSQLPGNS